MEISRKLKMYAVILPAAALFFAPFASTAQAGSKEHHHGPHWGYEGEHGPEHWGGMSKDFEACSHGKQQSPIDISLAVEEDLGDITFNYKPGKLNILNNGHTIQANYDEGSSITLNGAEYSLLQFHFHGPSEHTVGGKSFDIEAHFVHKNKDGKLAVVGVLIEEGKENAAYAPVSKNLPKKAGKVETIKGASINAQELLPQGKTYYTYPGSLTTPPCSEAVTWLVLKEPIQMSKAQIDALKKVMGKNNRPVQPLHEREVKSDI